MIREKAEEMRWKLHAEAASRFIWKVQEEDNISYEEQRSLCVGESEPVDYHYTLGYKLQDPIVQLGLWGPGTKKAKEKVAKMFEAELTPEEIEIFRNEVLVEKNKRQFRGAMKKAKEED